VEPLAAAAARACDRGFDQPSPDSLATFSRCDDRVSGVTAYTISNSASVGCCFFGDETVNVNCPFPDIATGGGFNADDVNIQSSGPNNGNGWFAHATGGVDGGTVTVYVRCLDVNA
jgi:hypothetical protein